MRIKVDRKSAAKAEEEISAKERVAAANVRNNDFTFAGALAACSRLVSIRNGKQVHGHLIRTSWLCQYFGVDLNRVIVGSSLNVAYAVAKVNALKLKQWRKLNRLQLRQLAS
ncbi:hypothetical protein D5086_032507 [Populus alba]|uniref:Uncharacterized protein n=1 Tax=Populus alba TaxID=43335 RepID=A0ACC4ALK4_POPAL